YSLFVLLAPHLNNGGAGNTAWVGEVRGMPMLFAERDGTALALACSAGWKKRSAGFVGVSDGWQDLERNHRMEWSYTRAEDGNVALGGGVDLLPWGGRSPLAPGFGRNCGEAAPRAAASLWDGFDRAASDYCRAWQEWQRGLLPLDRETRGDRDLYRV